MQGLEISEPPATKVTPMERALGLRGDILPVLNSKLNIALLAAPVALVVSLIGGNQSLLFVLSLTALCPCAERLGYVTEQLAGHTNDTIGGLLNATFGNVTELVIAIFAIKGGLLRVVQLSLLGSVVSNLLLVLGTSFVLGGIYFPLQSFNVQGVGVNSSLLVLAAFGLLLPSTLQYSATEAVAGSSELLFSRLTSLIMLLVYGALLLFQLRTHRHIFDGSAEQDCLPPGGAVVRPLAKAQHGDGAKLLPGPNHSSSDSPNVIDADPELGAAGHNGQAQRSGNGEADSCQETDRCDNDDDDDDDDEIVLSFWGCIIWLAALALLISFLSDWIVHSIETASRGLNVPLPFLSTIVLPIVGNAAEHFSAINFAMRNRMELTMGIAVGSATQIAMLVMPLTVVVGWMMGQPLDLNLSIFETIVFFGSILTTIIVVQHASSHWLKGTTLLAAYAFLCVGFWLHRDPMLENA